MKIFKKFLPETILGGCLALVAFLTIAGAGPYPSQLPAHSHSSAATGGVITDITHPGTVTAGRFVTTGANGDSSFGNVTSTAAFTLTAPSTFTAAGNVVITGTMTVTGDVSGNAVAAGQVGELIKATNGGVLQNLTSGQFVNLVSIALTPGYWEISTEAGFSLNGATANGAIQVAVSTFSANTTTDQIEGDNQATAIAPISSAGSNMKIGTYYLTLTTSKTVYWKALCNTSAGTMQARGRMYARRYR